MHLEQGVTSPSTCPRSSLHCIWPCSKIRGVSSLQGSGTPGGALSTAARQSTMQRPAGSSCSSTFLSTGRCPRASSRSYLHGKSCRDPLACQVLLFLQVMHAFCLPKMLKKQQALGTPMRQVMLLK